MKLFKIINRYRIITLFIFLVVFNWAIFFIDYLFGDKDGKIEIFNFSEHFFYFSVIIFFVIFLLDRYKNKKVYPFQWLIIINVLIFISLIIITELCLLFFEIQKEKNIIQFKFNNQPYYLGKSEDYDLVDLERSPRHFVHPQDQNLIIPYDQEGIHINIFENKRVTCYQPNKTEKIVYIFGGSTIFSNQVSDSLTICSLIQKKLNKEGIKAKVINMGVISITVEQQLKRLKLDSKIKKGDIVIFYDGVNDITERIYHGRKFGGLPKYFEIDPIQKYLSNFSTGRFLIKISKRSPKVYVENIEEASKEYCKILNEAKSFVEDKGGIFFHFFQPNLFSQKKRFGGELEILKEATQKNFPKLAFVFEKSLPVFENSIENLSFSMNLKTSFDSLNSSPFLDFCHVNQYGNKVIAEKIWEKILF